MCIMRLYGRITHKYKRDDTVYEMYTTHADLKENVAIIVTWHYLTLPYSFPFNQPEIIF